MDVFLLWFFGFLSHLTSPAVSVFTFCVYVTFDNMKEISNYYIIIIPTFPFPYITSVAPIHFQNRTLKKKKNTFHSSAPGPSPCPILFFIFTVYNQINSYWVLTNNSDEPKTIGQSIFSVFLFQHSYVIYTLYFLDIVLTHTYLLLDVVWNSI